MLERTVKTPPPRPLHVEKSGVARNGKFVPQSKLLPRAVNSGNDGVKPTLISLTCNQPG